MRKAILPAFAAITCLIVWILCQPDIPHTAPHKSTATTPTATPTHQQTTAQSKQLTAATTSPSPSATSNNPVFYTTPKHTNSELLKTAKKLEKNKHTYRFATAIPVNLTPENSGQWQSHNGTDTWQLNIISNHATSINLGMKRYFMPPGGKLLIHHPDKPSPYRAFTSADNEDHGELWTPIIPGNQFAVTVTIPSTQRQHLNLTISSVNHGFRPWKNPHQKIGGGTSDICNVDAICRSGDPFISATFGPILDFYDNQIRSVAAYTLSGTDTCSGALINNTANDQRGFFLTADHCGINNSNDASAVFYFNFQNSYCRPRGTPENAGVADGNLSQFISGCNFRAASSSSDFCLVELDDPIPASYDVYFAGWDRSDSAATTTVGIHHPSVAEKRISVDLDTLVSSDNYWDVADWDLGTTQGGSSGSPLFDSNGRIVGQLFGGNAACGNNLSDSYGKISKSWTGDGSSSSRLKNWLDPGNTGVTTLDGLAPHKAITIHDATITEGNSGNTSMEFTLHLSATATQTTTVQFQTANSSASAGSDFTNSSGTATFQIGDTETTITIPVTGDTTPENDEHFLVNLTNPNGAIIRHSQATGTILNDDYQTPTITSATNTSGQVDVPYNYQITTLNTPRNFRLAGCPPVGMQINTTTGLVTWVPTSQGTHNFTVEASNDAGTSTQQVTINTNAPDLLLDSIEINNKGASSTQGTFPWTRQTSVTHDSSDALKSANITHNQNSSFTLTAQGPGTVSFWVKTSTEEDYDHFYFTQNGNTLFAASGNTNWVQKTYPLDPGNNSLSWIYSRDFSEGGGSNAVWIDEIIFTGYAAWAGNYKILSAATFNGDTDCDDIPTGIEYATGMMPDTPDVHLLPTVQLNSGLLEYHFSKPIGISGISYDAEISTNLINWTTTGRDIITNNSSTFRARQSTPSPTNTYLRLKVYPTP